MFPKDIARHNSVYKDTNQTNFLECYSMPQKYAPVQLQLYIPLKNRVNRKKIKDQYFEAKKFMNNNIRKKTIRKTILIVISLNNMIWLISYLVNA